MKYNDINMLVLMNWSALIFVYHNRLIIHEPDYGHSNILEYVDEFHIPRFRNARHFEETCLYLLL